MSRHITPLPGEFNVERPWLAETCRLAKIDPPLGSLRHILVHPNPTNAQGFHEIERLTEMVTNALTVLNNAGAASVAMNAIQGLSLRDSELIWDATPPAQDDGDRPYNPLDDTRDRSCDYGHGFERIFASGIVGAARDWEHRQFAARGQCRIKTLYLVSMNDGFRDAVRSCPVPPDGAQQGDL
jgi:hypothetical protein